MSEEPVISNKDEEDVVLNRQMLAYVPSNSAMLQLHLIE